MRHLYAACVSVVEKRTQEIGLENSGLKWREGRDQSMGVGIFKVYIMRMPPCMCAALRCKLAERVGGLKGSLAWHGSLFTRGQGHASSGVSTSLVVQLRV